MRNYDPSRLCLPYKLSVAEHPARCAEAHAQRGPRTATDFKVQVVERSSRNGMYKIQTVPSQTVGGDVCERLERNFWQEDRIRRCLLWWFPVIV